MYNKNITLLLLILVFTILFLNRKNETYINYDLKLPNSIMKYFTKNKLHNIEKSKVIVLKYKDNSLNAFKYINTTLYDFLKNNNKNTDKFRYQIKQVFNNNILSKYILKHAYFPTIKYLKLNKNNVEPGNIRISKSNWSFDYHFDCVNIILVQLIGTRILYLKNKITDKKYTKHILKPGNIFYIKMGVYHKIETYSDLNINFSISVLEKNEKKINSCEKKFEKSFKVQNEKCLENDCI
jgi:hypothetical protein